MSRNNLRAVRYLGGLRILRGDFEGRSRNPKKHGCPEEFSSLASRINVSRRQQENELHLNLDRIDVITLKSVISNRWLSGARRGGCCTPTMNDDDEHHTQSLRRDRYRNTLFPRTSTQQSSLPDDADTQTHHRPANMVWKKRIRHFTWTFFTMTMATGGIANVLHTGSDLLFFGKLELTDKTDVLRCQCLSVLEASKP